MPSAVAASAVAASAIASNSTSLPAASPGEPAAVGDQLARANLMRQAGRWKDAEAAYVGIAKRFTGASEAEVASLAAATLRLEHLADPEGALRLYESVARGGRLNVEALFGVARCQRALGNQPAEQAALSKVIEQAPQSLQADRARPRLLQLQK
jgi:tetratricopeptide (TPR) repeat protein